MIETGGNLHWKLNVDLRKRTVTRDLIKRNKTLRESCGLMESDLWFDLIMYHLIGFQANLKLHHCLKMSLKSIK